VTAGRLALDCRSVFSFRSFQRDDLFSLFNLMQALSSFKRASAFLVSSCVWLGDSILSTLAMSHEEFCFLVGPLFDESSGSSAFSLHSLSFFSSPIAFALRCLRKLRILISVLTDELSFLSHGAFLPDPSDGSLIRVQTYSGLFFPPPPPKHQPPPPPPPPRPPPPPASLFASCRF